MYGRGDPAPTMIPTCDRWENRDDVLFCNRCLQICDVLSIQREDDMLAQLTIFKHDFTDRRLLPDELVHYRPDRRSRDGQFLRPCELPQVGVEFDNRHNIWWCMGDPSGLAVVIPAL